MSNEINMRYDVCAICQEINKLCVVLYDNENITVCLHCLRELFNAWDYNNCEKLDYIGTPEYVENCKKEYD